MGCLTRCTNCNERERLYDAIPPGETATRYSPIAGFDRAESTAFDCDVAAILTAAPQTFRLLEQTAKGTAL